MKRSLLISALGLALGLAIASCRNPDPEPIMGGPQPGDVIQIPAIEWRVVDEATMLKAYKANGMSVGPGQQLMGFTGKRIGDGKYVIYSTAPRYVNDEATDTLGHEVLHVVAGGYHEEVQ